MKPWQNTFEVRRVLRVREGEPFPDRLYSYAVFYKGTDNRPNSRYYSIERDAERGAAQIYNRIEKSLLG